MRELKTKAVYRHFKGKYYYVEDVAIHSEDKSEYVVYRGLVLWVIILTARGRHQTTD